MKENTEGRRNGWILTIIAVAIVIAVAILKNSALSRHSSYSEQERANSGHVDSSASSSSSSSAKFGGSVFTVPLDLPHGAKKLELVKVEKGSFDMSRSDGKNDDDEVQHNVSLHNDFYIGKYEVTQAQWEAVMGTTLRQQRDNAGSSYRLCGEGNNYPMYYVDRHEAREFCDRLNKKGLVPANWKFSLPTETQWEYAAHGGHKRTRYYKYSGSDNIGDVAWYDSNSSSQTHPVGQKKSNDLGLHDMSGNVWEWCLDNYEKKINNATREFFRIKDSVILICMTRGCSWNNNAMFYRSPCRMRYQSTCLGSILGFRLALVPVQ